MSPIAKATFIAASLFTAFSVPKAEGLGAYPPVFLIQAEQALEDGDASRTVELLNRRYKRLRSPANRIRGYAALCRAYLQEQELQRAAWACTKATDMDLAGWSDFNNRGVLELQLGRFDAALKSFEKARALNPESEAVSNNLTRTRAIIDNELISSAR